jgi:hypothetical protein
MGCANTSTELQNPEFAKPCRLGRLDRSGRYLEYLLRNLPNGAAGAGTLMPSSCNRCSALAGREFSRITVFRCAHRRPRAAPRPVV